MAPVHGRTCGKLAWLRPRHTTSIWERMARAIARAMELSVVRELFSVFDADGDGLLSQEEFAMFLRGIKLWGTEAWGQHEGFTDDDWAQRWPGECQKFECTTGEIAVAVLN